MSLPRLGILHASFGAAAGLRDIRRAADGRYEPVIIMSGRDARAHPTVLKAAIAMFHVVVVGDLSSIVTRLCLHGVTTFHDAHLEQADEIAAQLGIPSSGSIRGAWDGLIQRGILGSHGLTRMRGHAVDSPDDLQRGMAALPGPWRLRPRRHRPTTPDIPLPDRSAAEWQLRSRRLWQGLMLETSATSGAITAGRLPSPTILVATISTGTTRHHVAAWINDGTTTNPDRPSAFRPMPMEMAAGPAQFASRCLDSLRVRRRVTLTRLAITAAGPELMDIDACPGAGLGLLLRQTQDTDLIALAMIVAAGEAPPARDMKGLAEPISVAPAAAVRW